MKPLEPRSRRIRIPALFLAALPLLPLPARGQEGDCPPGAERIGDLAVYRACQLDVVPRPILDTAGFRQMGYSACADETMHLVVDRTGVVREVALQRASPAERLCDALARGWSFTAATRNGSAVAARLPVTLRYAVPSQADLLWDPVVDWRRQDNDFTLAIAWVPPPRSGQPLGAATADSAMAAVVQAVVGHGAFEDLDHVCVDLTGREDRAERVLELMGLLDRPRFTRAECPSIIPLANGGVGYVRDPPYLHVGIRGALRRAGPGSIIVDAWYARGLGGAGFRCRADRGPLLWRARCVNLWVA